MLFIAPGFFPTTATAQKPDLAFRVSIGKTGLAGDAELGFPKVVMYARDQGAIFGEYGIGTVGVRAWPFGVSGRGAYVYAGSSWMRCRELFSNGGVSGCDGDLHRAPTVGAGFDLGESTSMFSAFAEGGTWLKNRALEDVPDWTFSTGLRIAIPLWQE